ncbi:MAG: D-aminoacylase [Cyclobacteriaceae bacterium]
MKKLMLFSFCVALFACQSEKYDVIIRHGTVYDGSGQAPVVTDIGIHADTIAFIGDLSHAKSTTEIDATGLAVSPGFINMLSWATESLILDGRGQSDIRQGVTLEVFGEGWSMGPINANMKKQMEDVMRRDPDWKYPIDWTTLGEYLESLERNGISPNVASFVGATTARIHELGYDKRPPTSQELDRMKALVKQAMEEGALGVGSSLIYAPANYSSTEELIALCRVAGEYGGMYITHMRSEGNSILEAVDETIRIAREANLPAEIYHLKLSGQSNWSKLDSVIAKIEQANQSGLRITADMYTYTAGATGLDAAMPPWVQEGGLISWIKRLQNPTTRKQILQEMRTPTNAWENLYMLAGDPENVLLLSFANDSLKQFIGKTLGEVARIHGKSPEETAMDLVIADSTRVGTAYFLMNEENIKRQLSLPFVSLGSDEGAPSTEGVFLKSNSHPRAYGNFARFLGKYVRDQKLMPLEEAVRRMTSLPAGNLKIKKRGSLQPGFFADITIFDPRHILDHATFEKPHQYATGVIHVLVNGAQVLANGEHTGAKPGRVVRGPGWKK